MVRLRAGHPFCYPGPMDNITHTLVGAALAQTGLKRWTPLARTALMLGANLPDLDIISGLFGNSAYLEHHRGITHALIALVPQAALLAGSLDAGSRWWQRRRSDLPAQPARFLPLFALSLLAIVTHPLLDFTNSYGWRPFLPFSRNWAYGDIAFVIDPWVWILLGGGLCLATARTRLRLIAWSAFFAVLAVPILFFDGAGLPLKLGWVGLVLLTLMLRAVLNLDESQGFVLLRVVLLVLLAYFGALTWLHHKALSWLAAAAPTLAQGQTVTQVDALPVPLNPLQWTAVISTDQGYCLIQLRLYSQTVPELNASARRFARASGTLDAIAGAAQMPAVQTFLRFARYPVIEASRRNDQTTEVEIRDARFMDLSGRAQNSFRVHIRLDQNLRPVLEK